MSRRAPLALFIFAVFLAWATPSSARWNYRIGEPAPEFQLQALDGNMYRSSELKGNWLVVSFMTTWCPFCNAAAPHFDKIKKDFSERGVTSFIVDVAEDPKIVAGWAEKHKLTCGVLLDNDGAATIRYAPPQELVLPDLKREEVMIASFMIIDPAGIIRYLSLNEEPMSFDARLPDLRAKLNDFLAKQR